MADADHPFFAYHYDAWSYVERARKQLQLFDAGNPESLFYAALELRLGIEARITDELKRILEDRKRPTSKLEEYGLGELYKNLINTDKNTRDFITIMFGTPGSQASTTLQHTPVTAELKKDWGLVSNLLHYNFFLKEENKEWYHKVKILPNADNMKSLVDYREMLEEIVGHLENASSGDLLIPPTFFLQFVDEVDADAKE